MTVHRELLASVSTMTGEMLDAINRGDTIAARRWAKETRCSTARTDLRVRALVVHQHGPLENLKLETFPDPCPGPDEVLVEVYAASVNFPDLLVIGVSPVP